MRRGALGEAFASVDADGERARLTVTGLKPLGNGGFYELWLLGEDGELVGLGSFRVDPSGAANVTVPDARRP